MVRIEGENLVLRDHIEDDFDFYHKLTSDNDVMRFVDWKSISIEESKERFQNALDQTESKSREKYFFAVLEKESSQLRGECGFTLLKDNSNSAEIGFFLEKSSTGKGYGAEIVNLLIEFCFEKLKLTKVFGECAIDNISSSKTMLNAGMTEVERFLTKYKRQNTERLKVKYCIRNCPKSLKDEIKTIVLNVSPFDQIESQHQAEVINWIDAGKQLFRLRKPNIPNKHLVSYFCLLDQKAKKILLVEHKKALLWLPPGGHVDLNEHPFETVKRECFEELNIKADFLSREPIFITSTVTVGTTAGHTDISLWYVLKGDSNQELQFDNDEFSSIKWFSTDEIPFEKSDPHLKRFISKLTKGYL